MVGSQRVLQPGDYVVFQAFIVNGRQNVDRFLYLVTDQAPLVKRVDAFSAMIFPRLSISTLDCIYELIGKEFTATRINKETSRRNAFS